MEFLPIELLHRAKKSRRESAHPPSVGAPAASPAVPQPAAAAAINAASVDDAASVGEEHQTNENPSSSPASQIDDHTSATAAKRPHQGPANDAQIDGEIHPNKHSRGPDSSDEWEEDTRLRQIWTARNTQLAHENPSSSPASQIDDDTSATAAKRPHQGPAEDAQIDGEIHPNKHSRGPDSSDEWGEDTRLRHIWTARNTQLENEITPHFTI